MGMKPKMLVLINSSTGLYDFRNELLSELSKSYCIVVSTPDSGKIDLIKKLGCEVIITPIDRRGINPVVDLKLINNYRKIINKEKPDYILAYTIKPNIYGGFLARVKKINYAVNITGLGTTFQKDGLLQSIVTKMYRIAFKKANVVFFENIENKNIIVNKKIVPDSKCCVLNGAGVNLDRYSYLEYPVDCKTTRFLFIGRVMQEKGFDELYTAMQRLVDEGFDCKLDVLGSYEEDYKKKIDSAVEAGWLSYYGYRNDVRPFIEKSHCFVLPSWHEGMANTNLECASSGRPVITSNIHGCKEAVLDGTTGYLCESQNIDSLYECMKKFIALSYQKRKDMGKAGRKHMENFFDKRIIVDSTIKNLK
jgi:glycosyltransferase involved in cell wall biosynthesis|nr:glycosyltransferase family 4 protein [Ruminococcus bromii]